MFIGFYFFILFRTRGYRLFCQGNIELRTKDLLIELANVLAWYEIAWYAFVNPPLSSI
jgi:hypothetical protein